MLEISSNGTRATQATRMVSTRPVKIPGRWRDGYALDYHTISSTYLGDDQYGRAQFDTKRSEVGELLFRLKYRTDDTAVAPLVETIVAFITAWKPGIDLIVPVPPSRPRPNQPVLLLAEKVADKLRIPNAPTCVSRSSTVPELKNIYAYDERFRLLTDAHAIDRSRVAGKRVLLFDDLYRSGATMNAITIALYDAGAAHDVFALTVTRTRSNQ